MILAAGRSSRLGSMGLALPKPLLPVCGYPVVTYGIELCRRAGLTDIVINLHHHGDKIGQTLGDGSQFGVNLLHLAPGVWSSQRHWHSDEDEFVYLLEGEVTLVEDGGETLMRAGDCAAFPKGTGNGHHLINRSSAMAVYLEVGSRNPNDLTTCSDIDMMSANSDGRFVHKDGKPYKE